MVFVSNLLYSYNTVLQAHPKVAQKLKFMLKSWADMKEFKDDAACK